MTTKAIVLIAKHFFQKTFISKGLLVLLGVFLLLLGYITSSRWTAFEAHHHEVEHHQAIARASWESNPDKHPHRMAHFGNFAFREQHPLCIFDSGIETYTGNAIFLEAHKQHTANFSEASLSTGLARFGNLDIAMLLQLVLPLLIFFIGYGAITAEREKETLKLMYLQGASMLDVVLGKSLGLLGIAALFFIPSLVALWSITFLESHIPNAAIVIRIVLLTIAYLLFFVILCGVSVLVSAKSKNSNQSLLTLLGGWLLLFVILPKTAQVVGNYVYPNVSKIEFKAQVEEELLKKGDSHNPDDPYFNAIRDSILKAHKVNSIKELPFNYGGFLMQKGEQMTAEIYSRHHEQLIQTYMHQNSITRALQWINPYLAIKKISMGLSGTDFDTYVHFLTQTEAYRYQQSQFMNELQMKFISNEAKSSEGKTHVVKQEYWNEAPKFTYEFVTMNSTLKHQSWAIGALCFWALVIVGVVFKFSNQFKVI